MEEIEKDFYYNVGLLSTKFAIAEQYSQDILCLTISREENDTATITLIEDFTLSKTLNLLTKIIKIRSYWEKDISEMIKKLDKVRIVRNLFIHGLWKTPHKIGNIINVSVETKKIKFKEYPPDPELVKIGYSHSYSTREWEFNHHQTFTLEQIKKIIIDIDNIIMIQKNIISDMKLKLEL